MSAPFALSQELSALLADPGFTPGAKHLDPLFEALLNADKNLVRKIERTLGRAGKTAGLAACARAGAAAPAGLARLLGVLGRVAQTDPEPKFLEALWAGFEHSEERVRRVAIQALGKLEQPELEPRLLARWPHAGESERRSLAEALGKSGGPAAIAHLRGLESKDAELSRIAERAVLMLARDQARDEPSQIALDRPLGTPLSMVARCRSGLAWVLAAELQERLGVKGSAGADRVRFTHRGTLKDLLSVRTAFDFAFEWPLRGKAAEALEERVVATLAEAEVERAVVTWTEGRARFRLAFAEGGHQRERVWGIAAKITERVPWLHNDPHESTWEVLVDGARGVLELRPQRFEDPRFAYRARDVRAASHPTLAAALARVAGVQPNDVVWDPFVGSGLELIERALLGPYRGLYGTDIERPALDAAREKCQTRGRESERPRARGCASQSHPGRHADREQPAHGASRCARRHPGHLARNVRGPRRARVGSWRPAGVALAPA